MNSKNIAYYIFYSILIAGAYYGSGILVRPLILPPTFAAPIWPAAGIAVAVLILWGYKYIPAILLGEILINFNFYEFDSFSDKPTLIFTYTGMLLATVIRSVVGAYLVRNHLGQTNNFLTLQSIIKLLIFAGLIPTFLSTFLSTLALVASGLLSQNSLLINFSTWWIGDSLGVFIVLPLMFLIFKTPREVWKPRLFKTAIPVIVTFLLVLIVALSLNKLEHKRLMEKLINETDILTDEVLNKISQKNPIINGVAQQEIISNINEIFISDTDNFAVSKQLQDIHFIVYSLEKSKYNKIFESKNKPPQSKNWSISRMFKFANHEWQVTAVVTSKYFINHSSWLLWWLLSIGFLFVVFLAVGLLTITGNSIMINDVVIKRTNEINTLNNILKESESRYKQLIEIQPVIFWKHTIGEEQLDFVSNEAVNILGYSKKELLSLNVILDKMFHPDDRSATIRKYYQGIKSNKRFSINYRGLTKLGKIMWFKDYISTKIIDGKKVVIGLKIDISKEQEKEQEIIQLAYFDSLTQLPNRVKFMLELRKSILKASKSNVFGGILYLNLDRFKIVNDSMGRYFGDKLLLQVSQRLKKLLRKTDIISRFGSDEFAILIRNQSISHLKTQNNMRYVAEKIQKTMKQPFDIDGHHFYTSFSIGISVFPTDSDGVERIIQQANIAMYVAKGRGKNTICRFKKAMQEEVNKRLNIEKSLKIALIRSEFEMYYQPIFNHNMEVLRLESLIRWHHPESGLIMPQDFIHIAEETGFINELSEWIIDNVFDQISQWRRLENIILPVSINISLYQFNNTKLVKTLKSAIKKYKIDAHQVSLELTESIGIENFANALVKLKKLKELGFKLAIDDFGTGYSSLTYLTQMPIDILKLDKSFVAKIGTDENSDKLIETIFLMSKQLDLCVIVEGVETELQFQFLKDIGYVEFQGFLASKAVRAEEVKGLLAKNLLSSV